MARRYCNCGRKIVVYKSKGYKGVKQGKDDHDLCQKCWKAFRDKTGGIQWISAGARLSRD